MKRFWSKVRIKRSNECWEWIASKTKKGYGWFRFGGRPHCAHRIAWLIARGPIPGALHVLHKCDNPSCCNPTHLFLGTNQDNVADSVRKGRHKTPRHNLRGEQINTAKLKCLQVLEIRKLWKSGESSRSIGRRFKVSKTAILAIIHGRCWNHV